MKKEQVVNCQFSVWYPRFKRLSIRSVIIPLPENVKDYLLDDGTLVVSGREDSAVCSYPDSNSNEVEEEEEVQWSDDENTATLTAPEFPEFSIKVQEAINSLGGSVFPKMNWSSPRDAYWIALNSSLKCKTLSDIFLLFKSSDFVTHDFTQPFIHCTDDSPDPSVKYELVLRKWCELIPGGEFRCFVKENKIIVVFDIYRDSEGKIWLIDFNPFGEVTDSLLFTWDELTSGTNPGAEEAVDQDSPTFRCTTSEVTVQPSPYLSYRLPKDFVDLSTGEDAHKLIDFLKLKRNQEEEDEDD
ncbi:translation initiation factor eIF2 assembly protein-like isoform X2 [Hyperolius riggenbachi]|uniref:translation initiation factor eIF2 assembly protein-like isoform X2 n=1 Tax=Hyperolius riggenbachi TaxID=752182 RepID=UPI0035A3B2EF